MKSERKKGYLLMMAGMVVVVIAFLLSFHNQKRIRPDAIHHLLQQRFTDKEKQLDACIGAILDADIQDIHTLLEFCKTKRINEEEFVFYIYQQDELKAWSSNIVFLPSRWNNRMTRLDGMVQLDHKALYAEHRQHGQMKVLGMYVLRNPHSPDASFLKLNLFPSPSTGININTIDNTEGNYLIKNRENKAVFALEMPARIRESDEMACMEMLLWLLGITLFVAGMYHVLVQQTDTASKKNRCTLCLVVLILLLFQPLFHQDIFSSMHASNLFSSLYCAYGFHSLGELFMGSYSILLITVVLYKQRTLSGRSKGNGVLLFLHLFLLHLCYFATFFFLYNTVLNASVSLFPSLPLRATGGERLLLFKVLFSISLTSILCALHLVMDRYYHECRRIAADNRQWLRSFTVALLSAWLLVFFLFLFLYAKDTLLFVCISVVYLFYALITFLHVNASVKHFSLRYYAITCLLSAFLLSLVFENANSKRLVNSKESFANSLLENDDPLLRYNLNEVSQQIRQDTYLQSMLSDTGVQRDEFVNYLQNSYFQPYFENYRHQLFVGRMQVPSDRMLINRYLDNFEKSQKDSLFPNIGVSSASMGEQTYVLKEAVANTERENDSLYIFFLVMANSDFFKPTYLLSRREHRLENEMLMFSCAEYSDNVLQVSRDQRGVFKLHFSDYHLDTLYNGMTFYEDRNEFVVYYKNPDKIILLSTPKKTVGAILSLYAYLFIILGMFSILLSLIINFNSRYMLMFRHRVQVFIVTIILLMSLVSMLLFSVFAHSFSQIELNQNAMHRINLIVSLLPTENLTPDSSNNACLDRQLLTALYQLPRVYVENVNIYTLQGEGVVHMDKNLPISQSLNRLNPYVIESIANQHNIFYVDNVFMNGKLNATILYRALSNREGEVVAYLGYPTRQRGGYLEYLFASVIPVFLNIYLLFTILFAIFGSVFSNYFVLSLNKIAQLLSKVKLKSVNQKIAWKYDDEIGLLVKDYNRLVDDLEISAEMLARSSKESAWKELAQQVAHEIKNPLTPMKLRTQQLQKRMKSGNLTEEDIDHYTEMMIGQIDALSEITSSFSSLAKIHQGNGQKENLLEIMQCAVDTYENSADYLYLFEHDSQLQEAWIRTDRQQMLRVFNNLIKNAMQAKKSEVQQRIILSLSDYDEHFWKVLVTDFGCGMDEQSQKMAFIPHFTTKSSGSGLGLAIVKNILSDWGGDISFQSVKNEYTVFTIHIPKYEEK